MERKWMLKVHTEYTQRERIEEKLPLDKKKIIIIKIRQ